MEETKKEKKLKPVVFVSGKYDYNTSSPTREIMLLKAMTITKDPNKLRELIGVKSVADVYRTLDKMSIRKEYHSALARKGITFDYIVGHIKQEIDNATKAKDKFTGLGMLLKSMGLDKYEDVTTNNVGWEDALLKITKEKETEGKIIEVEDYKVAEPLMPEHIRIKKEQQKEETRQLYE